MKLAAIAAKSRALQYTASLACVAGTTLISWSVFREETYWAPSILYLFVIIILGGFLGRGPTILAAALSALAWDFLFIPPRYTLQVGKWEDALILLTYAAIAGMTSLYTWRLRQSRELAEEGARQAQEARASEELYRIVFNSISHEMRSPLTAIMGASSALYLIGDGEVVKAEDRRVLLREIIRSAVRLSRLVDNFLNVSRLEANRMQLRLEDVDLRSTIHDVLQTLKEELSAHKLEILVPDAPVLVRGDAGLLQQAVFCVAHNAAQYTPPGTVVRLELKPGLEPRLVLEDNGPGIGETDPSRLFEKFFRAQGSPPGGAGLGLGIARGIMELHGGTLTAARTASGGMQFVFSFPASRGNSG